MCVCMSVRVCVWFDNKRIMMTSLKKYCQIWQRDPASTVCLYECAHMWMCVDTSALVHAVRTHTKVTLLLSAVANLATRLIYV